MKHILVFLLLCVLYMNAGVFTLGLKEDANMMTSKSCIEKERQALLIFKANLFNSSGNLDDWGSEEEKRDCCLWVGVICNDHTGHVIELDLSYKSLNGSISVSLGDLTSLTRLDLSGNDFIGDLPSSVGQLSKLYYLDVSNNLLNGNIPDFTGCPSLSTLGLSRNNFTGDLPSSVGQLLNLERLDVSGNSLNGNIPDFTGCPSLSTLDLSGNHFTGDFPSSVGQLLNLSYLDVSNNSLNGNFPEFTGCPSLSTLVLSGNQFTGDLPSSVGQLSNVKLNNSTDQWHFTPTNNNYYSVKHLRILIDQIHLGSLDNPIRWNKTAPVKVNIHCWRVRLDRLATRHNLVSRNIDVHSSSCPVCDNCGDETNDHLFVHCNTARVIWNLVIKWWNVLPPTAWNIVGLSTWADSTALNSEATRFFDLVTQTTLWIIWRNRNRICFQNSPSTPEALFDEVVLLSYHWISNRSRNFKFSWIDWTIAPYSCNSTLM